MAQQVENAPVPSKVQEEVLAAVDPQRILELEQACVRLESDTFEEGRVADLFAEYMVSIGLDVEMVPVIDPHGSGKVSRQPIGHLRGTGGGKSLMFDGHMDHNPVVGDWEREPFSGEFDGTYIHGRGAQDDKGGIVAAISAVEAIVRAGVRLRGDVYVCPVAAHKSGGFGTKALLARGLKPDYAINVENSANGLATVTVGALKGDLHAFATPTHAHSTPDRISRYISRIEQIARVIAVIGPAERRAAEDGWLTFEPSPDLPDFPIVYFDRIVEVPAESRTTLEFHLRTVPGMTRDSVTADFERVTAGIRLENPNVDLRLDIPPKSGKYGPGWDWPPVWIDPADPLPTAVRNAHRMVAGVAPIEGAQPRLGAVGDASFLQAAGVKSVLYGPGDIRIFKVWPTPDERVALDELTNCAKVLAIAAVDLCGMA